MRFIDCINSIKVYLTTLNLFDSHQSRSNPFNHRSALISTRLYVSTLTLCLFSLMSYTYFVSRTLSGYVENPSESQYRTLLSKYASSLTCSCSKTLISYRMIAEIQVDYHPACSSWLVSEDWINHLVDEPITDFYQLDFRSSITGHLKVLRTLCQNAKRVVNDEIENFLSASLLNIDLLDQETIEAAVRTRANYVRQVATNNYRSLFGLIRVTTHSNMLQTSLQTSIINILLYMVNDQVAVAVHEGIYYQPDESVCSCAVRPDCNLASGFHNIRLTDVLLTFSQYFRPIKNVTGFVAGCYSMESFAASTLQCFYDMNCLEIIFEYVRLLTNEVDLSSLMLTEAKQFSSNDKIETIQQQLFIDDFSVTIAYADYFSQCAPKLCSYTYSTNNNLLYVLTTFLGLYGGLTVFLRFLVPHVVQVFRIHVLSRRSPQNQSVRRRFTISKMISDLYQKICSFTLYTDESNGSDPFKLRTSILATRIYLTLLTISVLILTIYTSLIVETQTITIEKPSITIYNALQLSYSSILNCPCRRIETEYGQFFSIDPKFHPICSSDYIGENWIQAVSGRLSTDFSTNYYDFRLAGKSFFISLGALCFWSQNIIEDTFFIFNRSSFVTSSVLVEREFYARTTANVDKFKGDTVKQFQRALNLIEAHAHSLFASSRTNVNLKQNDDLVLPPDHFHYFPIYNEDNNCSCALGRTCLTPMAFYESDIVSSIQDGIIFIVPNLFVGCSFLDGLAQSSLECFFNDTCLRKVITLLQTDRTPSMVILDLNKTKYPINQSLHTIIESMMIEEWRDKINYTHYYNNCAPKYCTYQIKIQRSLWVVMTTIFALLGGLAKVWKYVAWFPTNWIRNYRRQRHERSRSSNTTNQMIQPRSLIIMLRRQLLQLNLFETPTTAIDEQRRQYQLVTTRLYLFLLIFSITIIAVYTWFQTVDQIIRIDQPSLESFLKIQTKPSLDCPCENLAIPYGDFLEIEMNYHQLCSSDLIMNAKWIEQFYVRRGPFLYAYNDYRLFTFSQVRWLISFCRLANETWSDSLTILLASRWIGTRAKSVMLLELEINDVLDDFRSTTINQFRHALDLIQNMTDSNGIVTSTFSNWYFPPFESPYTYTPLKMQAHSYGDGNCSCAKASICTEPARIDDWSVPGFYIGCFPLDSLLRSSLSCFYQTACLDRLQSYFPTSNVQVDPLNATLSNPNETVESLINRLMLHDWSLKVNFNQYFSICAPNECSYTVQQNVGYPYVITTIVGLYGGLAVALRILVPLPIKVAFIVHRRYRQSHVATIIQ